MRRKRKYRHPIGSTLTEVVMATLVVGVVLVGALEVVGNSIRTSVAAAEVAIGPRLADELLAEIMSQPYVDPETGSTAIGRETGEPAALRSKYDDVDDYDGWQSIPPTNKGGAPDSTYAGWTRSVEVDWADRLTGNQWLLDDTGLKRIVVTVTDPDGTQTQRIGFRHEWGMLQSPPAQSATVITFVSATLEIGDAGAKTSAGTNLFNHVVDPNE